MTRKDCTLIVLLALTAGFLGGIGSSRLLGEQSVFAQKKPKAERLIQAQEFRLVDEEGRTRAVLGVGHPDHPGVDVHFDILGRASHILLRTLVDDEPGLEIHHDTNAAFFSAKDLFMVRSGNAETGSIHLQNSRKTNLCLSHAGDSIDLHFDKGLQSIEMRKERKVVWQSTVNTKEGS